MKKLIVALTVSLTCLGAFAQGKVNFINNSLHLIYYTTDSSKLSTEDQALAGQAVPSNGSGSLSPSHSLLVDLYAGTSAGSLSRVATTTVSTGALAGTWNGANVSMSPGGVNFNGTTAVAAGIDFFQVQVYDGSMGSYAAASGGTNVYYGESIVFQSTASSATAYYSIVQHTTPGNSQWTDGTQAVAGGFGAIAMQLNPASVPEPTTFALAGLGAAALLIFRRRNK